MKRRRKQREVHAHAGAWGACVLVVALCLAGFGLVRGGLALVDSWLEDLPPIANPETFAYAEKTRVYAKDGTTLLAEFFLENRDPVALADISPLVVDATIATEDARFYEHEGVDPLGIARALVRNLQGGNIEGASTITQQLVRNTALVEEATEVTFKRKIREAQLALEMEQRYSKDAILNMYLNMINYGDGCYGIEAAAQNYFSKSAAEVTLNEAATLAGIPQSPTYLNPLTNPDACLVRRNIVLGRLLETGHIDQASYDATLAEPLALKPAPDNPADGIFAYPYFTSYVRQLLLDKYGDVTVFKGGLTVYTTLDPVLQEKAQAAAAAQYERMDGDLDVSLTSIDPATGHILAMIGGKDYYASDQFNLATQARRQAGSSFKTFTLVSAIEQGISPQTNIDCSSPLKIGDWRVENYGGASYGTRSIQSATAISSNTGFARLIQTVKPEAVVEVAHRMGVTSPLEAVDSITLGSQGVNTLEMADAYATLAAGGTQRESVAITKIIAADGSVLAEHVDTPVVALTPEVSYATTQVLKTVFTGGTATAAQLPSGQVAAGKTGTSENWRDHWLCGYTPQLSTAVWIGARIERETPQWLDCSALWRDYMSAALDGVALADFATAGSPPYNNPFNKTQPKTPPKQEPKKEPKEENPAAAPAAPNVVGMSLSAATAALAGYAAEYVEAYSATVPAGVVIGQEMVGGTVRLTVSLGPEPAPPPPPAPPPAPASTP
ncbi:MAG: transglycosylase domain-containing protein [Raoultibacter sp.]